MNINKTIDKALSRRNFLVGAGTTAATVAAATLVAGCGNDNNNSGSSGGTTSYSDTDILNFALNLEYLEASFYLYAATGSGLAATDTTAGSASGYSTVGTVTQGSAAKVAGTTTTQQQIINEIAFEEQQHVKALRFLLGTKAVPMPNIDLSFFGPLATAAGITGATFNPFASFDAFLIGAFIFEDVGVTAYLGAAPLISAAGVSVGYLSDAAGILAVEAYHAAYIRTALTANAVKAGATSPTSSAYPYPGIANQVGALRATLTVGNSGAPGSSNTGNSGAAGSSASVEVPLTVPTSATSISSIVAADSKSAIAFGRTTNQVLHIVYGSATVGAKSGGFFPSGINSVFATTTA
ncbi:MAG: ferritin-like domain-containing protein [Acidobacteriota bacterium]